MKVSRDKAAEILDKLGICKAFGPSGKVNGPNCQRFGHQDTSSRVWWWSVPELIDIARHGCKVPTEIIESVAKDYGVSVESPQSPIGGAGHGRRIQTPNSRAEAEKEFRELLLDLEAVLRSAVRGDGRDTFGKLIAKGENSLPKHIKAELSFINATRNSLYHSSGTVIDDDALNRAINSAEDLTSFLLKKSIICVYRSLRGDGPRAKTVAGYEFQHICDLHPVRDTDKSVRPFMPQERYSGAQCLHSYGAGPFCRFNIPTSFRDSGVYILSTGEQRLYVGECKSLSSRFNDGYGNISPRNCFQGGQETNCRLNNLIYEATQGGQQISLWFFPTANYKSTELELRVKLNPPWNRM